MARTLLTPFSGPLIRYPVLPLVALSHNWAVVAGTATDGFSFAATNRDVLLVQNANAGAQTATIVSVGDELGRSGDLGAYSIGAGLFSAFYVPIKGFMQSDGTIWVNVSHNDVKCAVLRLPSQ